MKNIISRPFYLVFSAFIMVSAAAYGGQDREVTFDVEKMSCAVCPITVRKAMQGVDGVKDVHVDLDTRTARVVYDADITTQEQIAESSTNAGFPASLADHQNQ